MYTVSSRSGPADGVEVARALIFLTLRLAVYGRDVGVYRLSPSQL